MSTKTTVGDLYGFPEDDNPGWHVYTDFYDEEWPEENTPVYLEIHGRIRFEASQGRVVIQIPRNIWNKIISYGAKNAKKSKNSPVAKKPQHPCPCPHCSAKRKRKK